jgi:hypothetical protein
MSNSYSAAPSIDVLPEASEADIRAGIRCIKEMIEIAEHQLAQIRAFNAVVSISVESSTPSEQRAGYEQK